jgi:hypothetical protein
MARAAVAVMLRHIHRLGILLGACAALGACEVRTNVSLTSSGSSQYSHVWITLSGVWFHTSATASATDAGWNKFPLSTPTTIDLARLSNGALAQIASGLKLPLGTYHQVRLLLADPAAPLTSSAQTAGARFNDEVDFLDANNVLHQVRLELVSPENGIAVPGTVVVPDATTLIVANLGPASSTAASSTSTSTSTTTTASTTATTTASGTTTSGAAILAIAVDLDVTRDVTPFTYSSVAGFLLNPHATAQTLSDAGTIQGQVNVASLPSQSVNALATGLLDAEVTAEGLSSDGTRHVAIMSAALRSDGSFVLYPLPKRSASGSTSSYDLVIHGGAVQSVVIGSVPVSPGAPARATSVSLAGVALAPAASFTVNFASGSPLTPAGARAGFYQTLPGRAEVPYLIDARCADPASGSFDSDFALSAAALQSAAFSAAQTLSLSTVTPVEGASTYQIGASAPLFSDSAFAPTVSAPSPASLTAALSIPALDVATAATAVSVSGSVQIARPGTYDRGLFIVSRDGAIVSASALDALLAQNAGTASLSLTGLPGGTASAVFEQGVYSAALWVWNSGDPAATFNRQSSDTVIDVTQGSAGGLAFQLN